MWLRGLLCGIAVVNFSLAGCGSQSRTFGQHKGDAGTGGDPVMGGSAGRNAAGRGGESAAGSEVGAAGAPDEVGEGGAGAGGPVGPIPCTASEYHDGTSCHALTVCTAGEFEQSPAKPDQDRVCAKLTQCGANEYEKTAPTATSDRGCSPASVCGAGTFVSIKPTAGNNRQCSPCPASTFSSALNAESCAAWSPCKSGETESVAPSGSSDRVCSACGSGKYGSTGQCQALTVCTATQYEVIAPTATTDRKCAAASVCPPGTRETAGPTATTDRQCSPCSANTYSTQTNAGICSPWTVCTANQFQSTPPTVVTDRVCTALTSCAAGTQILTSATATSDRVCKACDKNNFTTSANLMKCSDWSNCAAGFFAVPGTSTKDRTCTMCTSGFSTTTNAAACTPWKTCNSSQNQTKPGTSTSDVECTAKPDELLFHHGDTGASQFWYMNGMTRTGLADVDSTINTPDSSGWLPVARADFNKDGKTDILWQYGPSGGAIQVWYMNGGARIGNANFSSSLDTGWRILGSADFNKDGNPDLFVHNGTTGAFHVWFMNGITRTSEGNLSTSVGNLSLEVPDANGWVFFGTGDFNADGKTDILFHNGGSGATQVWYMDGISRTGLAEVSAPLVLKDDTGWRSLSVYDVNHDGQPDLLWHHVTSGEFQVWYMSGLARTNNTSFDKPLYLADSTGWRLVTK